MNSVSFRDSLSYLELFTFLLGDASILEEAFTHYFFTFFLNIVLIFL